MDVFAGNFSWNEPRWLLLMMLLPALYILLLMAERRRRARFGVLVLSAGDEKVWQFDSWRSALKLWLIILSFAAFVVSLAGPRLGWRLNEVQQNAADIVIAIDVSKSMLSRDLQPSRIERARRIVLELLEAAPGDRFGLVLFAGAAYVQCPLTFDHDALRSFLIDLDPELVPFGGTDLSAALKESLRAFGGSANSANVAQGKIIVLLSDGEDQTGNLDEAIAEVQRSQAKVIAVAMGTEAGGPIPEQSGGLLKDVDGRVVISKLDDKSLRSVAEKTGGHFVSGAGREVAVAQIYQTYFRESGLVKNQKVIKEKEWFDRYQWFTTLALLFLLMDLFWFDLKKSYAALAFAGLVGLAWPSDGRASDRSSYNEAVEASERLPLVESEKAFAALQDSSDKEVARRSLYNLGNLLGKQGRFEEAVKAYQRALDMNAQDQQVRDNLAWAKKRLAGSESQQKSEQQKSEQQKSEQQKSEQQKSEQQKSADTGESHESKDPDKIEAERLLRSIPEEPRRVAPIYRGRGSPPESSGRDW